MREKLVVGMIVGGALLLALPSLASAQVTYNVASTVDAHQANPGSTDCKSTLEGGACTLRSSVEAADNAAGEAVTINVPAGTYVFSQAISEGPSFQLEVGATSNGPASVSIIGTAGASSTIVDANYLDRAFQVDSGTNATISGLTIEHGRPGNPDDMGSDCPATQTAAAAGGGILDFGMLTLTGDVITDNVAQGSGGGVEDESTSPLSITGTTISSNTACTFAGETFIAQLAGDGGGVDETGAGFSEGTVTVDSSTISGNTAQNDGGGVDDGFFFSEARRHSTGQASTAAHARSPVPSSPTVAITDTTISGNSGGGNGGGVAGEGFGSLSLFADAVTGNTAAFSGGGVGGYDSESIANTTITGNTANGGGGSGGGGVEDSASRSGATATVSFSTVNDNTAAKGAAGGNIQSQAGAKMTVDDSIVTGGVGSGGTPDNCAGGVASGGYNLFDDDGSGCGAGAGTNDLVNKSPDLGSLQNNGGPTDTEALQHGSPAIDAASSSLCASETVNSSGAMVDQRGVTRPEGLACDIGAYEAAPVIGLTAAAQYNPINVGQQDTVTDVIGNNTAAVAPNVTFTDPGAGYTIDSVTPSQGTCTHTATTVQCNLGNISAGGSVTITIVVTGTSVGTITLNSSTNMSDFQANTSLEHATVQITVLGAGADVGVKVTPSPKRTDVGKHFKYILHVSNHGPEAAQDVTLKDQLPSRVSFVSIKGAHCSGKRKIHCSLGFMAVGASRKIRLTVRADTVGKATDRAQVSDTSPNDPNLSNNHAKASAEIFQPTVSIAPIGVVCPSGGGSADISVTGGAGVGVRKVAVYVGGALVKVATYGGIHHTRVVITAPVSASMLTAGQTSAVTAVLTDADGVQAHASSTLTMCTGAPS